MTLTAQTITLDNPVPTLIRPAVGQDGLVFEFPTRAGDEYTIYTGDTPNATTQMETIMASGETITLQAVSFSDEVTTPLIPVTLRISPLLDGVLVEWDSLDGATRKRHIIRGLVVSPALPDQYTQVFGDYRFTIIRGASLSDGPNNRTLETNNAAMIATLPNAIATFNSDAAFPPLSPSLDPTVTAGGPDKQFFRVQRSLGSQLDWDGDGVSNANEILARTNPFLRDSDFDGFSDLLELSNLDRNPILNERFFEVDLPPVGLRTGLAAYYDFETTQSASNGARFFPNRINGNFSLFGAAPVDDDGTASASARFDGNADRLVIDNSNLISSTNDFSVSFFFKLDRNSLQNPANGPTSGLWSYSLPNSVLIVAVNAVSLFGTDRIQVLTQANNEFSTAVVNPDDGNWHHMSIVHTNALRVYLDGTLIIQLPTNSSFPDGNMLIGSWSILQNFSNTFGNIDRLYIHQRALTFTEIQTLANQSKSDTDGDGIDDTDEIANGTNPLIVDPPG